MSTRINTNLDASNASRNLGKTSDMLSKNLQKLSSGLRINSAADDATGLAISERMKAQLGGLKAATNNASDAISLVQTAEGVLIEAHSMLLRMRELAVRSATDSVDDAARSINQNEVSRLLTNIDNIAAVTKYNGITLLDGTATDLVFQIGPNNTDNDRLTVTIGDATSAGIGADGVDISTKSGAQAAIDSLDIAIANISRIRSELGAAQNGLERNINSIGISIENTTASISRITDADMADEMVSFTKNNVLAKAAQSMLSQANSMPLGLLDLLK